MGLFTKSSAKQVYQITYMYLYLPKQYFTCLFNIGKNCNRTACTCRYMSVDATVAGHRKFWYK